MVVAVIVFLVIVLVLLLLRVMVESSSKEVEMKIPEQETKVIDGPMVNLVKPLDPVKTTSLTKDNIKKGIEISGEGYNISIKADSTSKVTIDSDWNPFILKSCSMDGVSEKARKKKIYLYKKYGLGYWGLYNRERIDYVIDEVYKPQLRSNNQCEAKVRKRLYAKGYKPWSLYLIPVMGEGGKLEHLYIADFLVGKTIVEVDGMTTHDPEYDRKMDELTNSLGYRTIRIPTCDLSDETIDKYLDLL